MLKTGVLLLNLGTPNHCDNLAVYRYLTEFLMDSRVIDLPSLMRFILVHLIIVPGRYKKTAKAYRQIWMEQGSPLLINSIAIKKALAQQLGETYQVELAMRYGHPNLQTALNSLSTCQMLRVIPLFPQYSSAATGSALEHFFNKISQQWNIPSVEIKHEFYHQTGFIMAVTDRIKEKLNKSIDSIDLLIFSFHGLPERHIDKSACHAHCDRIAPCPDIKQDNLYCYRAQCYKTAYLIAEQLKIEPSKFIVAFQSRLGRIPWIKPYTDLLLKDLIARGIQKIAVVCPSFVADCLETLEEVNIRMRKQWRLLGGKEFIFIPCVNDHPVWIKALSAMVI